MGLKAFSIANTEIHFFLEIFFSVIINNVKKY